MKPLILFILSMIIAFVFTPILAKFLNRIGIIDHPRLGKTNNPTIPRMGGILLIIISLVTFLFYSDILSIIPLMISFMIIGICGVIDDIYDLRWPIKISLQFLASIILIRFMIRGDIVIRLFGIIIPGFADVFVLSFFIVGAINSINLLDGLDGLVSSYSIVLLCVLIPLALFNVVLTATIKILISWKGTFK